MVEKKHKGGLIAVSGRKRIYAKPLKPVPAPPKSEKRGEKKS